MYILQITYEGLNSKELLLSELLEINNEFRLTGVEIEILFYTNWSTIRVDKVTEILSIEKVIEKAKEFSKRTKASKIRIVETYQEREDLYNEAINH